MIKKYSKEFLHDLSGQLWRPTNDPRNHIGKYCGIPEKAGYHVK